MRLTRPLWHGCLLCVLFLLPLLTGCDMLPSVSLTTDTPSPTSTPNTWHTVAPGVEVRSETWNSPSTTGVSDLISIVRLNLHNVKISVAYQPDQPLSMQQWMQKEQATALINGGYFDGQDRATALVVSNGQAYGTSYQGFGGMLAVTSNGKVQLRSLHNDPYNSSEALTEATQCTPMLLINGQRTRFNADTKASPRSVAALDKQGHLLFIVSPGVTFSLDDMATLLQKSDLNLLTALNLDGGSSTGLYVNDTNNSQSIAIDSYVNLPLMIVVKER
ncbi:MAG TPA: phosphodiester glycosidase family protein [Ktedonobacteraceae bacterium]